MVLISELLLIAVSAYTVRMVIKEKKFTLFTLIFFMFIVLYVIPIIFYWTSGVPDYGKHSGYNIAINDEMTALYYNMLILSGVVIFYNYIKNKLNTTGNNLIDIEKMGFTLSNIRFKNKNGLIIVFMAIILLPLIIILLSPNPENYLTTLGYYSSQGFSPTEVEIAFHHQVRIIVRIVFVCFILLRLLINHKLINIYIYMNMFFWLLLENKRTTFAFLVFAYAFIDSFRKRTNTKKIFKNFMYAGIIVLLYFFIYSFVSGKQAQSMSFIDLMRQYFFRDVDLKLSIYWRLNTNHFHLLDFNGQSLLYNLLFYIPRNFWADKPWPYDLYATSAAMGHATFTFYDWNVQVSWISELVANLGFIGFHLSIFSYIWLNNKIIKINKPIFSILSFYLMIKMSMLGFGSSVLEIILVLLAIATFYLIRQSKMARFRGINRMRRSYE